MPNRRNSSIAHNATAIPTPLGALWVEASADAIVRAEFRRLPDAADESRHPLLREARVQVRAYFARKLARFDLPLRYEGTPFQCAVWHAVAQLEFGHFVSYAEVARAINRPLAHRGVAAAMAKSPLDLLIPAHRVVGADGRLKGCAPRSIRARLVRFERATACAR